MKVLMIGWEFPPFVSGGLGTHCFNLAKSLSDKVQLTLLVPRSGVVIPGVNIIEVGVINVDPYVGGDKRKYDFSVLSKVDDYHSKCIDIAKELNEQNAFDVIHCHDWMTVGAGIAIKQATGKPLVFMVHSTEYDRGANLGVNPWILDREKAGMKAADVVIANSQRLKNQLIEKFGVPAEKIEVVYNAIDADRFQAIISEKLYKKEKVVLYLARLTLQKGPEFFLKAAEKVVEEEPNTKFVVAGTGHLMPQLINYTIEHNLTDKVIFTGFVPEENLPELYALSDVYVLPSVSEPFGITVLEAMASGTPTIVSKESGVIEIAKHCIKVDFWDVDDIANKIISVLRYKPLKKCLSRYGKDEVKNFTWDNAAKRTIDVYQRALSIGGVR